MHINSRVLTMLKSFRIPERITKILSSRHFHLSTLLLLISSFLFTCVAGGFFCFTDEKCGPAHWEGKCHRGILQSPVDLSIGYAENKPRNPIIFGKNFKGEQKGFLIANTGHTVCVQFKEDFTSNCGFRYWDINVEYIFAQLHFHWGVSNENGSEHSVGGNRYALEMHFVHYKKKHGTAIAALQSGDSSAIAVLGVLFNIGAHNKELEPIFEAIQTKALNETAQPQAANGSISLFRLLPEKKSMFRYQGSLTTPTCDEVVLWGIFDTPVELSKEQADIFHSIQFHHDLGHRIFNFRPLQYLNGRHIDYYQE